MLRSDKNNDTRLRMKTGTGNRSERVRTDSSNFNLDQSTKAISFRLWRMSIQYPERKMTAQNIGLFSSGTSVLLKIVSDYTCITSVKSLND